MLPITGSQLKSLCDGACNELVLVAPFMKFATLSRLLASVPDTVTLTCVTRWRPEEIIAGVSDLEIWPFLKQRSCTSLWLRPDLHAKFYRADNRCLIGSANLTNAALGWSTASNLEILVPAKNTDHHLALFEGALLASSVYVTDDLYEQMQMIIEQLHDLNPEFLAPSLEEVRDGTEEEEQDKAVSIAEWIPSLRDPRQLYTGYLKSPDKLIASSYKAATRDLAAFCPPQGLDRSSFEAFIGAILLQMPIIRHVDAFVEIPRRFGAVRDLLKTLPCARTQDFDATLAWQTLMRWLQYFFPSRYNLSVPNHSEIFVRLARH